MPKKSRSVQSATCYSAEDVIAWLRKTGTRKTLSEMSRYGIPNERALGVPMGQMKNFAKSIGTDHQLALTLWNTDMYEARTIAAFVDESDKVTSRQMDSWAKDFDNWAICDTVCFRLFDQTRFAWDKVEEWAPSPREFVRRAAFALIWALSVHDKTAKDSAFLRALKIIETAPPDDRPLVRKAVDMALRATGKRNRKLSAAAIKTATRMSKSDDKTTTWIGKHSLRELTSEGVQNRIA